MLRPNGSYMQRTTGMTDENEQEPVSGPAEDGPLAHREEWLIVGVGAATSDREQLATLLAHLRQHPEHAIILCVAQQGDTENDEILDAVAQVAAETVTPVADGMSVAAGEIYLVPSTMLVTLRDGRFQARRSPEPLGERGRIDSLLVSLAEEHRERAVAVLLAGTGGDGTLGVTAIKEQGGLAVAEEADDSARPLTFAPRTPSAIADYVLPVPRIADCVADYARHLIQVCEARSEEAVREEVAGQLGRVAAVLRNKTGHDFHGYKQNTFMRRVQRRMQVTQRATVDDYVGHLRDDHEEVQHLFNDMLIGVTQFFRDVREFEVLQSEVIPQLFEGKTAADQVRVWVLGCATGEEAYSLAILLREHMATLDVAPPVQIFATDIDGRALAAARVGRFSGAITRDLTPERLSRWFVREGDTYCVVKELREMCIFSQHNLIKDAPFSRLDLISCRNLLIYLNNDLQNRVIPLFHFSLRPGGCLFLGNSENVTRHSKLFAPVDRRYRIFRRLENQTRIVPDFPLSAGTDRRLPDPAVGRWTRPLESDLARRADRVAERYAPAYVIIDEQLEVLHFSERLGRFLDPSTGAANLNLLSLVHRDLRLDLRAAVDKAVSGQAAVKVPPLQIDLNGDALAVQMIVEPIRKANDEPQHLLVLFQDCEVIQHADEQQSLASPMLRDEHIQSLEADLRITRERLQATIEELESTNEELKSSNEEYQSINEELQSANEELETSKEELQSVNEELQTVNGELAHRVQELAKTNSDLKNLLESTQIATVFLDNEFRIKNFTPAVTEIFHLIESDVGRPITHIAGRIAYDDLANDVRRVLRTLVTVEREVTDHRSGNHYFMRILPYRSIDNFIAGVVLTFVDVTEITNAQQALSESDERFRMMAQTVPIILFTAQTDLNVDYLNPRFYEVTGMSQGSGLGIGWQAAVHPDDIEELQRRWLHSRASGEGFEMEHRLRSADGAFRWVLARAEPMRNDDGNLTRWFGSATDVHQHRTAEDRQKLLMAELQHRVKNILAVVRSIFSRTIGPEARFGDVADHFRGRLDALARTQNVLARTPEGGLDLEEMMRDELLSHTAHDGEQIHMVGPPVRLRPKAAEAIGLAVHELVTNAAKYGALATSTGRITISWRVYDGGTGPRLAWVWREVGVTFDDAAPVRSGFGRELIEHGLPYELGATTVLEFGRDGVRCAIEMALSDRVVIMTNPVLTGETEGE